MPARCRMFQPPRGGGMLRRWRARPRWSDAPADEDAPRSREDETSHAHLRVHPMNLSSRIQRTVLRRVASLPEPVVRLLTGPPVVSPEGSVLDVEAQLL